MSILHGPSFPDGGMPISAESLHASLADLPLEEQRTLGGGKVYKLALTFLRGLEWAAEWQQPCPHGSCPKAADTCPHALCPWPGCNQRRKAAHGCYQPCGNAQCKGSQTSNIRRDHDVEADTLLCEEALPGVDADLLEDIKWALALDATPPPDTAHGARIQSTANEIARMTPTEEHFKNVPTAFATCRMGRRDDGDWERIIPRTRWTSKPVQGRVLRGPNGQRTGIAVTEMVNGELMLVKAPYQKFNGRPWQLKPRAHTKRDSSRKRSSSVTAHQEKKRRRVPTIRFGARTDVMSACLTVAMSNRPDRSVPCFIDSGANINIMATRYSKPANGSHVPGEVRTLSGAMEKLGKPRTMRVKGWGNNMVTLHGYEETAATPLSGMACLIGMPGICKLRIDLNAVAFTERRGRPTLTFLSPRSSGKEHAIKVFDVFCGVGAVSYGLRQAGWNSIGMIDNNADCIAVCKKVFPESKIYLNDAVEPALTATLMQEKPDVVWLSPPCQPASSLNFRKRIDDPRAVAAVTACTHVAAAHPPLILIENVIPWTKTASYRQITRMLQNKAYNVTTHIIDLAKCGIPQNRRRLIVCAFLGRQTLGLADAITQLSRIPDAVIKDVIPRAKHIFFPPRPSRLQAYVISANKKCPTITTKCLGRPGKAMRPCAANSADLRQAVVLTVRDFAKLQGLPASFPLPYHKQSVAARLIGNLFPPAGAKMIAEAVTPTLKRFLQTQKVARQAVHDISPDEIRTGCERAWASWTQTLEVLEDQQSPNSHSQCRLSERVLRDYLTKHGDDATASLNKAYKVSDICINEDLNKATRDRILAICMRYEDVFLKNSHDLPRKVLGDDGKPYIHRITFKKDHKPTRVRAPEYVAGSATRAILEAWCEQGLQSGLLVKAENSRWASRVLTVAKYTMGGKREGVPDAIRIVVDLTRANTQKVATVPIFAHAHLELARVSGHKWYATLDTAKGYHGFDTDRPSSDSTAVWLPHNGTVALYRHTRAVMGDTTAGTTMNSRFAEAVANNVNEKARKHISNQADDFCLFANSLEDLLYALDELLKMFDKFHFTVNPTKVRIGHSSVEYWGFTFDKMGSRPSPRNLSPVRQLQVPRTLKQLQAVLGLFNFYSAYIRSFDKSKTPPRLLTYSELISPLQELTRGKKEGAAKFCARWGPPQQKAFETVQGILLAGVMLHAPDYTRPLRMCSDASDFGWGAALIQDKLPNTQPDGKGPILPTPDNVNVIRMWSKAWTDSQRKLPVYFRESLALCLGVKKCRPYVISSKFPLIAQTDHLPLTWIRKSSGKAAISQFLTSQIADVNFEISYLPGQLNVLADTISRPPFLGPLKPSTVGLDMMVKTLLGHLPTSAKSCRKPWTYAGKDTRRLANQIQEWRAGTNPVKKCSHSDQNIAEMDYDLAIIVPIAEVAGKVCGNLLRRGRPMACLLPTSLLHRVPQKMDGSYDPVVTRRVAQAGKICFATGEYLWVLFDKSAPAVHKVYQAVARVATVHAESPPPCSATDIGAASTWTYRLSDEEKKAAQKAGLKILSAVNGPQYVSDTTDPSTRIVVPPDKREALIDLTHKQSHHLGHNMNWAHLKPNYWWPQMQKDIRERVLACPLCKLAKGTRRASHLHWRGKPNSEPRTSWSFDFKGMPKSSNGSREIAGAVDMCTHKVILFALPNRTAQIVAEGIMEHIISREGTPLLFHSDCAAELMSRLMSHLWRLQGTTATQTLGHNATGNSLCERVWRYVNAAFRCLTDEQYKDWHKHLPAIASAWNATPTRTLGVSPFEASCGMAFRTPVLAIGAKQPTCPRAMNQNEITMLHNSAAAYRELARKNQAWSRNREASLKNSKGKWKHTFKVGDLVKIYIPPTASEAERRGRKVKHCFWYRGPAKVVKVLSNTSYTVQMCRTKRLYDRSIVNVTWWGPPAPEGALAEVNANTPPAHNEPTAAAAPASTGVYARNDIIAIKDDASDDTYWLADVTRVKGDGLHLAYYGTNGSNLKTACFRPLFVTKKNELAFKKEKGATRWTGQMSTHGLPGCVIARKLKLTKRGELSTNSFKVFGTLTSTLSHARVDKPKK